MYEGNVLLPESRLSESQRALVKETREFTKESLTNEEGYKRFISTVFDTETFLEEEIEVVQDYLMNSSRGKKFWKGLKTMVGHGIDDMDYRKMVKTNPWNRAWGVHRGGKGQVAARQFTDPIKTGTINVHEFTHAGQLSKMGWKKSVGQGFDDPLPFEERILKELDDIFSIKKNPKILENKKLLPTIMRVKNTTRSLLEKVKEYPGYRLGFTPFQRKLQKNVSSGAREIMEKQFSKRGGLLNYLKSEGKYHPEKTYKDHLLYVNDWWETTARLNEMRYVEHLGLDVKKSGAYRQLQQLYDDNFIKDIYKYAWAGIPIADAANLGEPDEHLNRLEKIE
tara:strand:+ start:40 stop:1050 length:1011 start_codon:yes stop_codon:yes gene_type:complete